MGGHCSSPACLEMVTALDLMSKAGDTSLPMLNLPSIFGDEDLDFSLFEDPVDVNTEESVHPKVADEEEVEVKDDGASMRVPAAAVDLWAGEEEKSSTCQGIGSTSSSGRLSSFSGSEGTNSDGCSEDDTKTDPSPPKDAKDDKAKEGADAEKPLMPGHGVDLEIPKDLYCAPSTSTIHTGGGTSFLPKLLFCC